MGTFVYVTLLTLYKSIITDQKSIVGKDILPGAWSMVGLGTRRVSTHYEECWIYVLRFY